MELRTQLQHQYNYHTYPIAAQRACLATSAEPTDLRQLVGDRGRDAPNQGTAQIAAEISLAHPGFRAVLLE